MIFRRFIRRVRVRVCGIVIREGRLLLIAHRKGGELYWLLPGGGVRYGETLPQALTREFREELGAEITASRFAFLCDSIEPRGKRHILNIAFWCDLGSSDLRLGKERRLYGYSFFDRDEVARARIYPPLNQPLVSIMEQGTIEGYLGSVWQE